MNVNGFFLDEQMTSSEKSEVYEQCIGCLNRICVTGDKEEVLTMIASLNYKIMLLGKDTFLRIDSEDKGESL